MKLSKTQLEVLRLMQEEWELGRTVDGYNAHYWIQKDGLGCGGEVKKVRYTTGFALYTKGLIETVPCKFRYPTAHYCLTEKGRKALEVKKITKQFGGRTYKIVNRTCKRCGLKQDTDDMHKLKSGYHCNDRLNCTKRLEEGSE